ncbi:MAG: CBS domain-containing protein [Balneolaceae bacterium]
MQVQDILTKKGTEVYHIIPVATVFDAISLMSTYNVGALLVMETDELLGILSDKDYRNKIILKGRTSRDTLVKEIMTAGPITVTPDESVETCMTIMTEKKIRHLPVMEGSRVKGVVSIGDMVKSIIDQQKAEINDLRHYISGSYPS